MWDKANSYPEAPKPSRDQWLLIVKAVRRVKKLRVVAMSDFKWGQQLAAAPQMGRYELSAMKPAWSNGKWQVFILTCMTLVRQVRRLFSLGLLQMTVPTFTMHIGSTC